MNSSDRDELTHLISSVFVAKLTHRRRGRSPCTQETFGAETLIRCESTTARVEILLCLPGLPMVSVAVRRRTDELYLRYSGHADKNAAAIARRYYGLIEGPHFRRRDVRAQATALALSYVDLQAAALLQLLESGANGAIVRPAACWLVERGPRSPHRR